MKLNAQLSLVNQGGNHEDGAFANFIVAKGDIAMHIPSNLTYTSAAALPSGLGTVALGLYQHLGLSLPPATVDGSEWLFVYGGSSATGSLAIQYAKLYVSHRLKMRRKPPEKSQAQKPNLFQLRIQSRHNLLPSQL